MAYNLDTPRKYWRNWTLLICGVFILLFPYTGLPQPIKNFLLIIIGLAVVGVSSSILWPHYPRHKFKRELKRIRKSNDGPRVSQMLTTSDSAPADNEKT